MQFSVGQKKKRRKKSHGGGQTVGRMREVENESLYDGVRSDKRPSHDVFWFAEQRALTDSLCLLC